MRQMLSIFLTASLMLAPVARGVTIPPGTTVFCELDERVTSKKKETSRGDVVRARVWRDVWVEDELVIKAGTPVFARVSNVQKARMAGRKGKLELRAVKVAAVDGRDVSLDGGYDQSGRGRMGLSIALAAVVAWPLIFLKGKQAVLEAGTIFDAMTMGAVEVATGDGDRTVPKLKIAAPLEIEVLYDELDPEAKIVDLPLELRIDGTVGDAVVMAVNSENVEPIPIRLSPGAEEGSYRGLVDFKTLSKHFRRGMNRFDVHAGEHTAEVLLEIEL